MTRTRQLFVGAATCVVVSMPSFAAAQEQANPRLVSRQRTPTARSPTILWSTCDLKPDVTLETLATKTRPALWFSRDEPLDLSNPSSPVPSEWPRLKGSPHKDPLVYYRIKRLKSRSTDDQLAAALEHAVRQSGREPGTLPDDFIDPEVIATLPLTPDLLRHIREIAIRYLFYYPSEIGVGQHPHDLETAEFRLTVEHGDPQGRPVTSSTSTVCWQIRLITVYGSAHGLGAYTNILDVDAVFRETEPTVSGASEQVRADPFWPIVLLVEEGKHATAIDRNGDGAFTPGFDVNRFPADAWGVRDTMRTRRLAVAHSADEYKQRIPAIMVTEEGTLVSIDESERVKTQFAQFVRYIYDLRRPTEDTEVCGTAQGTDSRAIENQRKDALRAYADKLEDRLSQNGNAGDPRAKLEERDFCTGVELDNSIDVSDVGHKLNFGGARTSFTRFLETIPVSVRKDETWDWVLLVPLEYPLPLVGGSLVGRITGTLSRDPKMSSLDGMYMRSAARFADWYVAAGAEWVRLADTPTRHEPAFELGARIRFPIPGLGLFLGGRVAVRASGWPELSRGRIVYEFGSGIW